MQQLILENKPLMDKEDKSFPEFIRYFQYNPLSPNPYDPSNNSTNGSIGNGAYAYLIDCMHKCLTDSGEPDGFKELIDTLGTYRSPVISRKFIFERFYVVEIPDFSHEAMTQGYNDFVVYLFKSSGYKIPQRFIGLIKEYSSRRCFILIDKTYNDAFDADTKFKIIVEFKRNLELDINKNIDACSDHIFTDKYDYSFYSNGINATPENYLYSDYFNMNLKSIVNYQSKVSTSTDKKDYFRQVFENDYKSYLMSNAEMTFIRNKDNDISLEKENIGYKQESYEFIETTEFKKYYDFTFPEEFNVFDRDTGKLLIPARDYEILTENSKISGIKIIKDGITNIEVIPNFDNQRRIRISFENYSGEITDAFLHQVLRQAKLYRWNASDLKINVYKNGCLSELNATAETNDIITIMVIDRLKSDIDTNIPNSDANVTIIHENMNLPSSVNYMNPYTNSYKDNDEKEWENGEPVYIYKDDTFSKMYFDDNSKETDIHNGETDDTIRTTGEKYRKRVEQRSVEINERTKQLRNNLYGIMYNSRIGQTNIPGNKIINVNKNTEFVVINGTEVKQLEIKIPEISTEYTFNINHIDASDHIFVILPIWSMLETATIEVITSEANMTYRKMEATVK